MLVSSHLSALIHNFNSTILTLAESLSYPFRVVLPKFAAIRLEASCLMERFISSLRGEQGFKRNFMTGFFTSSNRSPHGDHRSPIAQQTPLFNELPERYMPGFVISETAVNAVTECPQVKIWCSICLENKSRSEFPDDRVTEKCTHDIESCSECIAPYD